MKKLSVFLCVMVMVFGIIGNVNAALIDRGGGLIYDSDQDITWLQDANYGAGSLYDDESDTIDGRMSWPNAVAWADNLVYQGYDDWRLPTTVDGPYVRGDDGTTTAGCNITTSEMGYMFYVNLGNLGYFDTDGNYQPGYGLNNTGPFINLQSNAYWSGTLFSDFPSGAWVFNFNNGDQGYDSDKSYRYYYAWSVRDGDSSLAPVPIPSAIWLLGSGLIGIVGLRKKF